MSIDPKTLKGFRDFLPKEARKREYVIETLKKVFESYGFEPLETPALEYEEILTGKYGDEGDQLMYKFVDNGDRNVALRYDQTVPLARVIAQYQNDLPMPFKRYQIQNVWRADNTQKGRFREFLQCDIDIVGEASVASDAEIIQVVDTCLKKLGFENYKILINDRKIFEGIDPKAVIIIDKLKKIGEDGVRNELSANGYDSNVLENLRTADPTEMIQKLLNSTDLGVSNLTYEPTLARGLNYYTGLIIEVEVEGFDTGSVGGGGRYDGLIGMFANQEIPAVGFAFGFDRIMEALDEGNKFPQNLTTSKVLITISNETLILSKNIAKSLRNIGINAETFLNPETQIEKQFKYAEKKEIPYVVIPLSESEVELRTKSLAGDIVKQTVYLDNLPNEIK